jgi:nucleotide-binding universal stress UspA family protein
MYKKILVPIDGSPTSNLGLHEALRLAQFHEARLRLLHVADAVIITPSLEGRRYVADAQQTLRNPARDPGGVFAGVRPESTGPCQAPRPEP